MQYSDGRRRRRRRRRREREREKERERESERDRELQSRLCLTNLKRMAHKVYFHISQHLS